MMWSLQILRFAAAFMVVYTHAAQTAFTATGAYGILPHELQIAGRAGVDIFFVISGVIIARTAPGLTWQEFAWRRIRRIYPLYLLITVPYLVLSAGTAFGWRDAAATILLWPATDRMTAPALPAAWTLCFEMIFYAAATLVLINKKLLAIILIFFVMLMAFRHQGGPVFQFLGNPLMAEFGFGVALAYMPRWGSAVWCLPVGAAAIVTMGFLGVAPQGGTMEFLAGDESLTRILTYGIPAALIVFGTMQMEARPGALTFMGDASYTLYLTHTLPISALLALWAVYPLPPDLIIAIGVTASLLLAWRIFVRVEAPMLRMLGKNAQQDARSPLDHAQAPSSRHGCAPGPLSRAEGPSERINLSETNTLPHAANSGSMKSC